MYCKEVSWLDLFIVNYEYEYEWNYEFCCGNIFEVNIDYCLLYLMVYVMFGLLIWLFEIKVYDVLYI